MSMREMLVKELQELKLLYDNNFIDRPLLFLKGPIIFPFSFFNA